MVYLRFHAMSQELAKCLDVELGICFQEVGELTCFSTIPWTFVLVVHVSVVHEDCVLEGRMAFITGGFFLFGGTDTGRPICGWRRRRHKGFVIRR